MESFLFRRIELWAVLALFLVLMLGTIVFGWLVLHHASGGKRLQWLGSAATEVAGIPNVLRDFAIGDTDDHLALVQRDGPAGFTVFKEPSRPNYLLVVGYDPSLRASVVDFIDEATRETTHRWVFDFDSDLVTGSDNPHLVEAQRNQPHTMRMVHPLLDPDGSLTGHFQYGALDRFSPCGELAWINADFAFHHSLERDAEGNFWSPGSRPTAIAGQGLDETFLDDHVVQISPEGRTVFSKSVTQILIDNDLVNLIYDYDAYQYDPIHLNDVEPILADGPNWRAGDLLLSLGHLNMVMQYRPSTDELIWWSQAKMMHQHDVDVLDDNRIVLFDNRRKTGADGSEITIEDNRLLEIDMASGAARHTWVEAMEREDVRTPSQGRMERIPGSGLLVEETDAGRLIKFDEDGETEWTYQNRGEDGRLWMLGWSRYVDRDRGDGIRRSIEERACEQ